MIIDKPKEWWIKKAESEGDAPVTAGAAPPCCDTQFPHIEHQRCHECGARVGVPLELLAFANSTLCPKCWVKKYHHPTESAVERYLRHVLAPYDGKVKTEEVLAQMKKTVVDAIIRLRDNGYLVPQVVLYADPQDSVKYRMETYWEQQS